MEELSRGNIYRFMAEKFEEHEGFPDLPINVYQEIRNTYDSLSQIYEKYEEYFLYEGVLPSSLSELVNKLEKELTDEESKFSKFTNNKKMLLISESLYSLNPILVESKSTESFKGYSYSDVNKLPNSKRSEYLFAKIVKIADSVADQIIDVIHEGVPEGMFSIQNINRYPQVFLSHAYADRVYTFGLFCYFLIRYKIYLYIDWMHNKIIPSGVTLKSSLYNALSNSSSLIFVASVRSELTIRGGSSVRQWCSWELGSFYGHNPPRSKFIIRLYAPIHQKQQKTSLNNILYGTLNPIKGIERGVGIF